MNNREEGYYWVLVDDILGWEIARYDPQVNWWYFTGSDMYCIEEQIQEIDERRITREPEVKILPYITKEEMKFLEYKSPKIIRIEDEKSGLGNKLFGLI